MGAAKQKSGARAMFTHRRVLAAASGAMAVASAAPLAAQPMAPHLERQADMDIKRNGSQPSRKGSEEYFTGTVRIDPLFQAPTPRGRERATSRLSPERALPGTHIPSGRH